MGTDREEISERLMIRVISYAQKHRRVVAALAYTGISTVSLGLAYLVHSDFNLGLVFGLQFAEPLLVLLLVN